jgi:diphthine synthase
MLTLVGLGLHDEKDLSLRGIEAIKRAEKVYIELYTSKWFGDVKRLEEITGKEIKVIGRPDLEENYERILEEAKEKNVVILVQGDPLVQTTHVALVLEAKKKRIDTEIVHNSSIISAIGETGLHTQKFGPYVTIPFPEKTKGLIPELLVETIEENKKRGLHTLCLLDVAERCMSVKEALEILVKAKALDESSEIVVCSKLGSKDAVIIYGKVEELREKEFDSPSVIIIPGSLHFTEKEYLYFFRP